MIIIVLELLKNVLWRRVCCWSILPYNDIASHATGDQHALVVRIADSRSQPGRRLVLRMLGYYLVRVVNGRRDDGAS